MIKKYVGIFLILLGIPWVVCMASLIPIGLRYGPISDQFFDREFISFYLLPGFLLGPVVGVAILPLAKKRRIMNDFRTKISVDEVFGAKIKQDNKQSGRSFWFFIVPLSAFLGFMLSVFIGANVFIPATIIFVVVLYGIFDRRKE